MNTYINFIFRNKKLLRVLACILFFGCTKGDDPMLLREKPIAKDDFLVSIRNKKIVLSNLLLNDLQIKDSRITYFDTKSVQGGIIEDNGNETYIYTPVNGFTGEDSFSYTICNNANPPDCSDATVTIQVLEPIVFNVPAEIIGYYEDLFMTSDQTLNFEQLEDHTVAHHTTILSYGQRHNYLYNADEDENNTDNVILMYSGESRYWEEYTSGTNPYPTQTFNTEHVFPQSRLESDAAVTDLHHLRACDAGVNEMRLNYPFTDGSGSYKLENEQWYPGDEWRGDVARMILYLNVRYGEEISKVGNLNLFLEWNAADPVSSFEIQRNNVIEGAQGNRNPFIDNPYLATLIWGGTPAENKWQ